MAFSHKSIQRSQIPINCQLCEDNPKIQWKCKDCNLLMCQTCKDKIHPKFKDASKHQIWDIKEVGLSTERQDINVDFSNIPCQKHSGQDCCLYCKACNYLVCATCVSTNHNGHKMGEIKEFYELQKNNVRNHQAELKINEKRLKEDELLLDKVKQSKSESYMKTKNEILSQKKALIEVVSIHADKLLYDLDQDHQSTIQTYDDSKGNIQKLKSELNKQSTDLEHISSTTEAATFLKNIENFKLVIKNVKSTELSDNTCIVTKFCSGHIIRQSSFGSLRKMTKRLQYKIMLETPKEFQTELNQICLIAVDTNNSLWLSDYESYLLQKVKLEDNHIEILNSFNIKAFGIAINEFNDLLLCTGDTRIKQINYGTDKVVDSVYNAAPFGAGSIHITKEKVIICGATKGRNVVILMDLKGKTQAIYEHDSNSKPLFKMPCILSSTYIGNIFSVDVDTKAGAYKVVVLGTEGKVINIYDGKKDLETRHSCNFFGIAKTPKDHIVVADQSNHLLHLLDSNGQFITYYQAKDIGISYPASLAFNLEGQLYIGCTGSPRNTPDDRKEKAKLYKVNFYEY